MTKKDYIMLAGHIRRLGDKVRAAGGTIPRELVRDFVWRMARDLADDLKNDNSAFDRSLFLDACIVDGEV